MNETLSQTIKGICEKFGNDRTRMMDIVRAVQQAEGGVNDEAMDLIAQSVNAHRVEVDGVVSFYAFLSEESKGKVVFRLCNDVVDKMKGFDSVAAALSEALGLSFGETTADGQFTLEQTPCIGMCDQAPAVLINDVVVTSLTEDKIKDIVAKLKANPDPTQLSLPQGEGQNADPLVQSMVQNNIKKKGEVLFGAHDDNSGLKKALMGTPEDAIAIIKEAKLRGRGGAGFPTGLKWEFTRAAKGDKKIVLCNADEGEPGTFKDRVLLTEKAPLLFEGMTLAGYAIGADTGIIYLRGEYVYLRKLLEAKLDERRANGLLGKNILGKEGFDFDIRIQMGAGAYICGEESALISSCEGFRGDPKTRPPFPAQKGYLAYPTTVNNVETFCCAARILSQGAAWFSEQGTMASPGTKLLSVSGDCAEPGIYEYPFGVKIEEILKDVGAQDVQAVLVGGPSGQIIGAADFGRTICYDDLATGGSMVIFNAERKILDIVKEYMEFFVEESCGYCTPCRVGNVLIKKCVDKILDGRGEPSDLGYLEELGQTIKGTSRCGLGQTSPNPVLTTLKNFRSVYESEVKSSEEGFQPSFDIQDALGVSVDLIGRKSEIYKD